ncbi:WD domain-containing protein 18 [Elsinoe australis]|uniref:WD domain-containing protein 18 n=1 Tax=Elsinoe australis TaxID=40998 RepID=A0A4U7B595_9PEZI|nr:WD domain-containing protein 18 [Elsinoe australis]
MVSLPQHARPRPDEGYSEEPDPSQGDSEGQMQVDIEDGDDGVQHAQGQLLSLSAPQRDAAFADVVGYLSPQERLQMFAHLVESLDPEHKEDLVKAAIESMPTSTIARVFGAFRHRLHINPADRLPMELTELIMLNLQPLDVIRCSIASHKWRLRALDVTLWKAFFLREGWMVDPDAIEGLLRRENHGPDTEARSHRRKYDASIEARESRKRQREAGRLDVTSNRAEDAQSWNEQHGHVEADDDNQMEGVESSTTVGRSTLADTEGLDSLSPQSVGLDTPHDGPHLREETLEAHRSAYELFPPLSPPVVLGAPGHKSINWHYLYKQRRRLESNWNEGRYKNFQLPHPQFQDEMHDECVYSIQYSGDHLVSGSRDRTLKVWDLNTQRCLRTLAGQHEQSVLCLQFDPDPEQNIIVSGGSDSYVVIWNFATGEVIKRMTTAHRESVLNLRFDNRYLITCSKDKTIKIWNRRTVRSDDRIVPHLLRNQYALDAPVDLEPYTLLGTLQGHGAAVNAVQIHEDTVVSASGDRTIRMWNVLTGDCIREFQGHGKGIACVQFDGRRIVSGSSDHTVRIFDAATKGEVACLQGHSNLVRTLQARFGDKTITDEELEALAKQTQDRWARNLDSLSHHSSMAPGRHGLDQIHDVRSLNAKIPQGGGGSKWSRIVSGSYDETVIIWKKDSDGKWIVSRRLHQDEVLSLHANRNRQRRGAVPPHQGHGHVHQGQQGGPQQPPQPGPGHGHQQPHAQVPGQNPAQGPAAAAQQPQGGPPPLIVPPRVHHHHHRPVNQHGQAPPAITPAQQQMLQQRQIAAQQHAAARRTQGAAEEQSNRVFKLQFDSRRIVCCSQNKIIVGWDFANGDEDLIEASKYFAETD